MTDTTSRDGASAPERAGLLTAAALVLAAVVLFAGLGALPLMQPDEGRNAEVAREMHESGSWLVPTLNGNAYLDKPAFFFKCSALCFSALGVSEFAARLPSALFGFGTVLLAWGSARRSFGPRSAALAVAIIATSPMFVVFSRLVIMDMTLAFFVVAAIFAGVRAAESDGPRRHGWLVLGAAMAGLGTTVKGPVGFVLPVLVLSAWHLVEGRPREILGLFRPVPLAVFWAIALAWFIPLCRARPDFLHYGLVEETVKRMATNSTNRAQPFYFYGIVVPAGFFAWSLLLPEGIPAAWRRRKQFTPMDRLCVVWALATVIFFSLSKTKQPGYVLSVAIPLGLLVTRLFDAAWRNPSGRAAAVIRHAVVLVAGVLAVLAAGLIALPAGTLGRIFNASPGTMAMMRPMMGPVSATLAVLGALGLVAAWRRSSAISLVFFAALLPALAGPNLRVISAYAGHRSCRELARALPPVPRAAEFVCLGTLPSALPFYLGRTVTFIDDNFGELGSNYILYSLRQSHAVVNLVPLADGERWLAAQTNAMFVLASRKSRKALEPFAAARGAAIEELPGRYCGAMFPARAP